MSSEISTDDTRLDESSIVIQGLLELSGFCSCGDAAPPATPSPPASLDCRAGDKVSGDAAWSPNTDDESTMSIGEIGVDEYFDDVVARGDVDYSAAATASGESSNGGGVASSNGGGVASSNGAGVASSNNGGGASSNNGGGVAAGGSSNDFRDKMNTALKLSHTCIMKTAKTKTAVTAAVTHVYSTPKPRAAAVRATEAISKCCPKRKRRPTATRDQKQTNTPSKEPKRIRLIEDPTLEDFGVLVPSLLYRNFFLDRRIMRQPKNCLITKLPAIPTVHDFLTDFTRKKNANQGVMEFIMETFNKSLTGSCLDFIERLQHKQIIERLPNRPVSQIYGIIHFTRFLAILKVTTDNAPLFTEVITPFLNGFLDYMDDEELGINFDIHYEHVMPDYYRMTFCPIRHYTKFNRT